MTCKLQDPVDSPASTASNTKSRPSSAGSKRTQRSAAWLTVREHATEWNNGFSRLLKDCCRRRDWQGYRREYVARIQPILVVMRTSPRAWIRKQYARQCEQYHTSDTLRMAEAIRHIMKHGGTSCIYTLFSQQHDKPYRGLVYQRPAMLRTQRYKTLGKKFYGLSRCTRCDGARVCNPTLRGACSHHDFLIGNHPQRLSTLLLFGTIQCAVARAVSRVSVVR